MFATYRTQCRSDEYITIKLQLFNGTTSHFIVKMLTLINDMMCSIVLQCLRKYKLFILTIIITVESKLKDKKRNDF